MDYPFGKAALWMLVIALVSGIMLGWVAQQRKAASPDLVFVTYSGEHAQAYLPAIRAFEKERHVKVSLQIVELAALQERLRAALEVNAAVPDMVEFGVVMMGNVMRGPIDQIGFWDLTARIRAAGLDRALVASRFSGFESRGHIFALPHDVHPVMLAYRRDLVEQLGIDVSTLTTWEEFVRVGRQVTRDTNGDGVIDRFMIDLPDDNHFGVEIMLLQQGQSNFDQAGNVAFDTDLSADTICWYVRQTEGPTRISFNCRSGQDLAKAVSDGLCLFYLCPDWRSQQFTLDVPSMAGKMAVMPMPAFKPGGRRTSTWGATGLAITRACPKKDLAWDLAMYLYYDPKKLAERYEASRILPPLRAAWSLPAYSRPDPYFSNQPLGKLYAAMAPDVPAKYSNPYTNRAEIALAQAYISTKLYYREHGEKRLWEFCRAKVHEAAEGVRKVQARDLVGDEGG